MRWVPQAWSAGWYAASGTVRGMALILLSALTAQSMNAMIRWLSSDIHPFEMVFFRTVFGVLVFAPLFVRHGLEPLRTQRLGLQLLRGALHVVFMMSLFTALTLIPLAKVSALNFTAPLMGTVLAVLFLGESLRARRVGALAVGFAGTLVILRPGVIAVEPGAMLVLVAASAFAASIIVIKIMSRTETTVSMTLYQSLFSLPIVTIATVPFWTTPSPAQLAVLVLLGPLGTIAHMSFAHAFKHADVSAVTPVEFTKLIFASFLGYMFFAEVPEVWTWVGGAMIFSAVVYLAIRERTPRAA
ncbi:MAG TPA: DMT family transporter [Rhodospirillales bacterium]|nr:DMT family transporter [Rhodospirillales bacterium]HJO68288.1 DMT family transporter [Rhodospirillales bacterium]